MAWNPIKTVKKLATDPLSPIKAAASGDVIGALEPGGVIKTTGINAKHLGASIKGIPKDLSNAWAGIRGQKHNSDKKVAEEQETMKANEASQYGQNQTYSDVLADQDNSFLQRMQGNVGKYQADLGQLGNEMNASQADAKNNYSNQIQPRLKGLMEQSQQNAGSAMSLKDAQDPNNKVAKSTRDLYSQQAQNEGRSNLADTATLQALGMQNMAGQLGNTPMTGGQLQALMGANQAQSGANYSKGLQRRQQLEDQGLEQGFKRSDIAYGQGQDAMNRYGKSIGDYEGAFDRQQGRDTNFRNQRAGIYNQDYNLNQQMNDTTRGVGQAGVQRNMAIYNTHMGGQQANIAGDIAGINAKQAASAAQTTGALQAGGTVVGAIYGGPAGAAAGNAAGQAAGNAAAPSPYSTPQYGNYGSASPSNPHPTMQQQNMGIQTYMEANPSGPSGYDYGGNGSQMGPPSPVGSSAGSQGAAGMNGLSLHDRQQQTLARRMRA
jgi:hypothetical protein